MTTTDIPNDIIARRSAAKVGDKLYAKATANISRSNAADFFVTVVKVGRKWLTCNREGYGTAIEWRYDIETGRDDSDRGSTYSAFGIEDLAEYEAAQTARARINRHGLRIEHSSATWTDAQRIALAQALDTIRGTENGDPR